jgi:hypothetical protein
MKSTSLRLIFMSALLLSPMHAIAVSDVDHMTDAEVTDYASRMSITLKQIQDNQLCVSDDVNCLRKEFARQGVSYDDKVAVQQRVMLMITNIY